MMGHKIVIAPYHYFSQIWTTKWYHYIKHLIEDQGWLCLDISDQRRFSSLKSAITDLLGDSHVDHLLFWHQNKYPHFTETFDKIESDITDRCRIYFYYDDVHFETYKKSLEIKKYATAVFSSSPRTVFQYYFELDADAIMDKYVFVPHAATDEFKQPFNLYPDNRIILSGAYILEIYPYRVQLWYMAKKPETEDKIFILHHPGYDKCQDNPKAMVGDKYAKILNIFRVGFGSSGLKKITTNTSTTTHYYVTSKFFEIPATGALLFYNSEIREELEQLGFKDKTNCWEYTGDNLADQLNYVLDPKNHEEIDQIRKTGQEFIWSHHMARHRAQQIDNYIKNH